jgi:hypothetical protein
VFAQQNPPVLALSPFASFQTYSSTLGFTQSLTYGVSLVYHSPLPQTAVFARIAFGKTDVEFDLVGSQDRIPVNTTSYQIGIHHQVLDVAGLFEIALSGSGGRISFSRPEKTISLGALGSTAISGKTETRTIYSVGALFSRSLSSRISVHLSPEAHIITPLSGKHGNYSISGGLAIGLL